MRRASRMRPGGRRRGRRSSCCCRCWPAAPRTRARRCRPPSPGESTTTTEPIDLTQVSLEPIAVTGQADVHHPARSAGARRPSSARSSTPTATPVPGRLRPGHLLRRPEQARGDRGPLRRRTGPTASSRCSAAGGGSGPGGPRSWPPSRTTRFFLGYTEQRPVRPQGQGRHRHRGDLEHGAQPAVHRVAGGAGRAGHHASRSTRRASSTARRSAGRP